MATWNSRGLRGSTLEELINRTNDQYREKGLALIQKIPTPITPVKMDRNSRHITLAYFEQKSTVDYIGAVQGIPVCFDAKECCVKTFPLANIHPHQVTFMEEFEKQRGIAFFLIYFSADNIFYYLTLRKLREFWKRMEDGGRKSFRRDELDEEFYLPGKSGFLLWRRSTCSVFFIHLKVCGTFMERNAAARNGSRRSSIRCFQDMDMKI